MAEQRQTDVMDPARARAMQIALGATPGIETGTPLPPFFHQLYFWEAQPPEALGRDGHPKVGGMIPDMGLPRRMWAGRSWSSTRLCARGCLRKSAAQSPKASANRGAPARWALSPCGMKSGRTGRSA